MTPHVPIMIVAVLLAATVMMVFAGPISDFVHRHPTMKMLALAFLILIGVMLVAEAFGQHVDKGYIYFAMAFSLGVELLNMRLRGGDAGAAAPYVHARRRVVEARRRQHTASGATGRLRRRAAWVRGHQRAWTRPMIASRGTGPHWRLSELRLRWSPITRYEPAGTRNGPQSSWLRKSAGM